MWAARGVHPSDTQLPTHFGRTQQYGLFQTSGYTSSETFIKLAITILDNYANAITEKMFVHEWAHLRYGVFNDYESSLELSANQHTFHKSSSSLIENKVDFSFRIYMFNVLHNQLTFYNIF